MSEYCVNCETTSAKLAAVTKERDEARQAALSEGVRAGEIERERDNSEGVLASVTDCLNTFCREHNVLECKDWLTLAVRETMKELVYKLRAHLAAVEKERDEAHERFTLMQEWKDRNASQRDRLAAALRDVPIGSSFAYVHPEGCDCWDCQRTKLLAELDAGEPSTNLRLTKANLADSDLVTRLAAALRESLRLLQYDATAECYCDPSVGACPCEVCDVKEQVAKIKPLLAELNQPEEKSDVH